jgi:hypothetical protein
MSQAGPRREPRLFCATRLPPLWCPTDGSPPLAIPSSPTPLGASPVCRTHLRPSKRRRRPSVRAVVVVHLSSPSLIAARPPWRAPFHPTGTHSLPLVQSFSTAPHSPVSRRRPARINRSSAAAPVAESFPYFGHGPKRPSGLNPLAGLGQAPQWARPTATVPVYIFLLNYSNSILIKVQTSKIVGN